MRYLQKEVGIKVGMEELKVSLDDIGKREFLGRYNKKIIYTYMKLSKNKILQIKQKIFPGRSEITKPSNLRSKCASGD